MSQALPRIVLHFTDVIQYLFVAPQLVVDNYSIFWMVNYLLTGKNQYFQKQQLILEGADSKSDFHVNSNIPSAFIYNLQWNDPRLIIKNKEIYTYE